mgnify:CR=1 FL=1
MKKNLVLLGLSFVSVVYGATPTKQPVGYNLRQFDMCFDIAADHYKVPSNLLKAIAQTESRGNKSAINMNTNGTYDVGIMQINSTWIPKLQRAGIERGLLLDPCSNIQIGAWILSDNIKRYGLTNEAIGRYNSSIPAYKRQYVMKVFSNYKKSQLADNI